MNPALKGQEMSSQHVVVSTRGPSEGKFTFTSHEPGECWRGQPYTQADRLIVLQEITTFACIRM